MGTSKRWSVTSHGRVALTLRLSTASVASQSRAICCSANCATSGTTPHVSTSPRARGRPGGTWGKIPVSSALCASVPDARGSTPSCRCLYHFRRSLLRYRRGQRCTVLQSEPSCGRRKRDRRSLTVTLSLRLPSSR